MRWDSEKYDSVKAPQIDAGRELIAMAQVRDIDSILDIGCGTGKLTVELSNLASKGFVVGIDSSEEMLEKARKVSADKGNINFIQIDAQSIDFTERFNLAFSNSVFQWIKEQQQVMELVYRSLKNGGRIAFQLPANKFCREFFDYINDSIALPELEKYYTNWVSPWYFPTKEEYVSLLKSAGFSRIEVLYKDYRLVFENVNEVLDWWASAGLRPYLELLDEKAKEYFKYAFAMSFENNRTENGIEFNFRRLFAFAEKS